MKLLPKLYTPLSGRVLIDGYDVTKVDLTSLRRQIGIVPQDSLLFEGSVSENIALNDPNSSADEIIEAAKIACAHDFIMTLPDGYATILSEKGSNLSGGQRQRIAIARTILCNPQLLIMDEATSALDYETERALCRNLQDWSIDKTVLFVTHRLPSIRNSDLIVVMHSGYLAESGTHSELMQLNSRYASLYRQQTVRLKTCFCKSVCRSGICLFGCEQFVIRFATTVPSCMLCSESSWGTPRSHPHVQFRH